MLIKRSFLFFYLVILFSFFFWIDVLLEASEIPTLSQPVTIVPSDMLPKEILVQNANNNLDIVWHDNRIFFAFRTAPTHFASKDTRLYVISSEDQKIWRFETSIYMKTDLREPRLLSWDGKLFLYFAVLGTNPLKFEPQGMMVSQYLGAGKWTKPVWFYEKGFIPWRTKVIGFIPYMLTYVGGENMYNKEASAIEVHWLTTKDGINWLPVIPNQPVVLSGGCSETDFEFTDDGTLLSVCRNELGDEMGEGSKICKANPSSLGNWECVSDPKKYDSPLVFKHNSEIYLIGRRNVTKTGNYDLGYDNLSPLAQRVLYELNYWKQPKRCSLWKVNPESSTISFILDLPSCGDTCFPGLIKLNPNQYLVYNYTSPLDKPDISWRQGQLGPTSIYSIVITFPK